MEIKIRQWVGRRRHALVKKTIREVCSLIMSDDTLAKIERVEVKILRHLSGENTIGTCNKKDQEEIYTIEIKESLDRKTFISTIAHEVAHMNQFAEGRLSNGPALFIWSVADKHHSYMVDNHTHEEYLSWPWEKEARAIEESYMCIVENRTPKKKIQ